MHFLSVEYGLPWALSLGEMLPPDAMIVHKAGILTPFHNLQNIMTYNDTLSTNPSWQPVDSSVDKDDAFEQLKENLTTKSFSGVFEFDNISDVLWNEMESLNIQDQIVRLQTKVYWTMPENYYKMSKMGLELLQSYAFGFGQNSLLFYDAKDDEQPYKVFEVILENLEGGK